MASLTANADKAKALEYVTKALEANPADADAAKLKRKVEQIISIKRNENIKNFWSVGSEVF